MSDLYNKASLVMNPQLVDTGKVYSIKPENRRGDFTFTRSSAATRVNADGLVEKGRENLLTYSNTFSDSSWYKVNTSVTSGQSGYDGTNNAWLLSKSAAAAQVYNDESGNISTFSIYAKEGTIGGIRLVISTTSTFDTADFNLTAGTLGSVGSVIDANIEDVGNGWYRCSITGGQVPITRLRIYPITSSGDASGTSGNIYIQDAQLEQGLVARDYIETTTTAVEGGITDNVPRLDYTDSSCPALLLEPQRTNYFRHSEYFETSDWGTITTTITTNNATSPDGYQNATTLTPTSASTNSGITSYLVTSATAHTMSVYAKVTSGTKSFRFFRYNSTDGSASSPTFTATTTWQRFTWTTTPSVAGSSWYITNAAADTIPFDIFGAQLEEGSYATSYIPTYGTSVTRNDDLCTATSVEDLIGQTEGVIYWEGSIPTADQNTNVCQFNNSTTSSVVLEKRSNGKIRARIWNSGSPVVSIQSNSYGDENLKIAFAYKSGDVALYINGAQILETNTTEFTFAQLLSGFQLGVGVLFFAYPNTSKPKQSMLFKTRLSNEELAALTTI